MTIAVQTGQEEIILAPQLMTNSATVTANYDTLGAAYATVRVNISSEINTNAGGPTISLLASNDTVVTNFATIVANQTTLDNTTDRLVTYHVDLKSIGRYLRLSFTSGATDTNDDVTVSATGTLTRMGIEPATTTDMGNSTNELVVVVS